MLYLPVGGDLDAVDDLRRRVWEPPLTRTLTWPFVPHVTLADDAAPATDRGGLRGPGRLPRRR